MQPLPGLPPHSSLPTAPAWTNHYASTKIYSYPSYQPDHPHTTAQALANSQATFAQPPYSYSSHYAQAYTNSYSLPSSSGNGFYPQTSLTNLTSGQNNNYGPSGSGVSQSCNFQAPPSWYQSGSSRCTYKNCTFTGSQKSIETHRMDRHLIFPDDWAKRPKKPDWDADLSLKGKPIPIQGTNIILDTPEMLDAWILERKRRWPSSSRVEEKQKKREEALARGQISVEDPSLLGRKRRRPCDEPNGTGCANGRDRGAATHRGWNQRMGRGQARGNSNRVGRGRGSISRSLPAHSQLPQKPISHEIRNSVSSEASEDDDDDAAPEILSSNVPTTDFLKSGLKASPPVDEKQSNGNSNAVSVIPAKKQQVRQPKNPQHNPFASRPILLRNLLLPEIDITVSNLSQAIRFLVDNDFLEGVELKPGEASEKMIEVIRNEF